MLQKKRRMKKNNNQKEKIEVKHENEILSVYYNWIFEK